MATATRKLGWLLAWAMCGVLLLSPWTGAGPYAWDARRVVSVAAQRGPQTLAAAQALQAAMSRVAGQRDAVMIPAINDFFNQRIAYREDIDNWGQVDYWASPMETLEKGAGDCEDFAIAKYFTLVALGIPNQRLRMVYVRALLDGGVIQPHMVLAYYPTPDADPWVLDSLVPGLRLASQRPDLTPVFSFNAEGIWAGTSGDRVHGHPGERLTRWGDVMRKARQEGFF